MINTMTRFVRAHSSATLGPLLMDGPNHNTHRHIQSSRSKICIVNCTVCGRYSFQNGRLARSESLEQRQRHVWSSIVSVSGNTAELVTLKLQAKENPPLDNSPYPVDPPANSSTGQKRTNVQYYCSI